MKRNSIILITIIALFFTSCSLISNPTEKENTSNNAVFTLSLGNSARTIGPEKISISDLQDITVTFINEKTNKEVTAIPTGSKYSWYIPEGTYTVTVNATANGTKVTGTASGVEVTIANGGSAKILLHYIMLNTGNVELTININKDASSKFTHAIQKSIMVKNGGEYPDEERPESLEISNSPTLYAVLTSLTNNEMYILNVKENWSNIISNPEYVESAEGKLTLTNNTPIPSGLYNFSFIYYMSDDDSIYIEIEDYCFSDTTIQVADDYTLTQDLSLIKNNKEENWYTQRKYNIVMISYQNPENPTDVDYEKTFIIPKETNFNINSIIPSNFSFEIEEVKKVSEYSECTPYEVNDDGTYLFLYDCALTLKLKTEEDLVINRNQLPISTYHIKSDETGTVYLKDGGSISGYDFHISPYGKTFVLNTSINTINEGNFSIANQNSKTTDVAVINNVLYFVINNETIYKTEPTVSADEKFTGTTIVLNDDIKCGTAIKIACHKEKDQLYYITEGGVVGRLGTDGIDIAKIPEDVINSHTISDFEIYDNILYILLKQHYENQISSGIIYALNLNNIPKNGEFPADYTGEPLTDNSLGNGRTIDADTSDTFLGPCKILGKDDSNIIYIADEGIYEENGTMKWRSRIMAFEHKTDLDTNPLSSRNDLAEKAVLSQTFSNTTNHFEETWDSTTEQFISNPE